MLRAYLELCDGFCESLITSSHVARQERNHDEAESNYVEAFCEEDIPITAFE